MTGTAALAGRDRAEGRRMGIWRLEWLRLVRTPRALALCVIYLAFGLIEPVSTKYSAQLVHRLAPGVRITLPPVTPAAGISSYVSNAGQIGLIIVVVIAAGAFSFDSRRGLATFLRTRVSGMWQLVGPRFAVSTLAAIVAYLLGTLAAWYETTLLIGHLPAGEIAAGILCGSVYLAFAVAVTGAAAAVARGTLATVGLAVAVLLLLPLVGTFRAVHDWLPSTLVAAPVDLLTGSHLSGFLPALGVAVAAGALALALAVNRLSAREI
ncbi:MAG TPA: hypothetical protein VN840_11200 [Streptosporangiaceae bacterium]|nr:hypothetical protein [Streptosporangiaceae bacterium]